MWSSHTPCAAAPARATVNPGRTGRTSRQLAVTRSTGCLDVRLRRRALRADSVAAFPRGNLRRQLARVSPIVPGYVIGVRISLQRREVEHEAKAVSKDVP